jgi:hypothetical protein
MSRNTDQGWNDLVSRSVDLGAGVLRLYAETVRDLTTGRISPTDLAGRAADVARNEGGAYARSLTRATIDYWAQVLDLGVELRDSMAMPGARGASSRTRESAGASDRPPGGIRLDFTGKQGEEVARPFVVENNQNEAVDVSFEVSPFVAAAASGDVRPPLAIEPESFTLEPGDEQVVTCRLTLSEDLTVGQRYEAALRVIGFPDMEIALSAIVVA